MGQKSTHRLDNDDIFEEKKKDWRKPGNYITQDFNIAFSIISRFVRWSLRLKKIIKYWPGGKIMAKIIKWGVKLCSLWK